MDSLHTKKSRIREILNLLMFADSSNNTKSLFFIRETLTLSMCADNSIVTEEEKKKNPGTIRNTSVCVGLSVTGSDPVHLFIPKSLLVQFSSETPPCFLGSLGPGPIGNTTLSLRLSESDPEQLLVFKYLRVQSGRPTLTTHKY